MFRRYRLSQINRACATIGGVAAENVELYVDWRNKTQEQKNTVMEYVKNIAETRLMQIDVFDHDGINTGTWSLVIPIIMTLVKWAIEWYIESRT